MPLSSLPEAMGGEQGGESLIMEPLEVLPMEPALQNRVIWLRKGLIFHWRGRSQGRPQLWKGAIWNSPRLM